MKTKHYKKVQQFHQLCGTKDPITPTVPDAKKRVLRARLVLEESLELIHALGCTVYWSDRETDESGRIDSKLDYTPYILNISDVVVADNDQVDLGEILDGACDVKVVVDGTLISCGIPGDEESQDIVDDNNLAKFDLPQCQEHGTMTHILDGNYTCSVCNITKNGPYKRNDGKWIKGRDHKKPDFGPLLEKYSL